MGGTIVNTEKWPLVKTAQKVTNSSKTHMVISLNIFAHLNHTQSQNQKSLKMITLMVVMVDLLMVDLLMVDLLKIQDLMLVLQLRQLLQLKKKVQANSLPVPPLSWLPSPSWPDDLIS